MPSNGLRVLVADDHQLVLDRVVSLLESHFTVVGTANNGEMLVQEAIRLEPDVIVTDIMMPGLNGLEAARRLREAGTTAIFIFLSVYAREEFVNACLAEGALGFVAKARMGADLLRAISEVKSGRQFVSPSIESV
jgi:DNA-binding NarL/FixJ family response regulator